MSEQSNRIFAKTNTTRLERYLEENPALTRNDVAAKLGYTGSSIHTWIQAGEMPVPADMALELIISREAPRPAALLITGDAGKLAAVSLMAEQLALDVATITL